MTHTFIPYTPSRMTHEQSLRVAEDFFARMDARRSVRFFSDARVPRKLIELAIRTASTAPSGAHLQPWTFVAISDPTVKREIRIAAEKEEYASYEGGRMSVQWRQVLAPIGTTWKKPFLETVPWIVVVFEQRFQWGADRQHRKNYYVKESVGIACGTFITALHQIGLATLTHTPSPMAFLSEILQRPDNERPFILFPIGSKWRLSGS